jgi:hypothetical protein
MFTKTLFEIKFILLNQFYRIKLLGVFLQHISHIVESIEWLPLMYQELKHYMQIRINI